MSAGRPARTPNAFIGSAVERREDLRFLRGRGEYVDDVALPGLLHAAILRSSVAHGRIRSIDTAAARARPGVHAVITAAEIGEPVPKIPLRQEATPEFMRFEQPVIAERKVRYVGEPIAVVIADSQALAEDALEAIEVDIESLPVVADRDIARRGEVLAFEDAGTNLTMVFSAVKGDAEAAFKSAPYTRREHFKVHRFTAVMMETRGFVAEWDAAAEQAHRVRRRQGRVSQPAHPGEAARPAGEVHPHGRERRRRRLRRARRVLSGGFPDPVRVASRRPAGEVDRGPPRASARQQSRARRRMRSGDRLRPRRHHPGPARTCLRRHWRLHPHQRRHRRAQRRAGADGALSRAEQPHRRVAAGHQQDAGRHLSRAGPLRGRFLPRAAVRHGGEGPGCRPCRLPAAQSHLRSRDAVSARHRHAARR